MSRQETCKSVAVESLLVDALKGMSVLLAYNRAVVERLEAIVVKVVNPIVRAYASYAVHEVDKVGRLLEAALIRLGARDLKVSEDEEEKLLGRALPRLMRELQSVLLDLERRVTKKGLLKFAELGHEVARLIAVQGMAYAKLVEDVAGDRDAATALRRAAEELLEQASKLRLMRRALSRFRLTKG